MFGGLFLPSATGGFRIASEPNRAGPQHGLKSLPENRPETSMGPTARAKRDGKMCWAVDPLKFGTCTLFDWYDSPSPGASRSHDSGTENQTFWKRAARLFSSPRERNTSRQNGPPPLCCGRLRFRRRALSICLFEPSKIQLLQSFQWNPSQVPYASLFGTPPPSPAKA